MGAVLVNVFYETVLAQALGGRDPIHLLLITATVAVLQGYLNPASLTNHLGMAPTGAIASDPVATDAQ
jgi:hypothetical protein